MDGGTAPFWPKSLLASKKLLHSSHITTISSRLELPQLLPTHTMATKVTTVQFALVIDQVNTRDYEICVTQTAHIQFTGCVSMIVFILSWSQSTCTCTHQHSHASRGNPLTQGNRRQEIIRQIYRLNHLCGSLSQRPPGSHQLKHYTSHYIPVISQPASLLLFLSLMVSFPSSNHSTVCRPPLSLSARSKILPPKMQSCHLKKLIESKNGRPGPDFRR